MLVYTVLLSMIVSTTWATIGVDVSQAVSEVDFHCLKSKFAFSKSKTYVFIIFTKVVATALLLLVSIKK